MGAQPNLSKALFVEQYVSESKVIKVSLNII